MAHGARAPEGRAAGLTRSLQIVPPRCLRHGSAACWMRPGTYPSLPRWWLPRRQRAFAIHAPDEVRDFRLGPLVPRGISVLVSGHPPEKSARYTLAADEMRDVGTIAGWPGRIIVHRCCRARSGKRDVRCQSKEHHGPRCRPWTTSWIPDLTTSPRATTTLRVGGGSGDATSSCGRPRRARRGRRRHARRGRRRARHGSEHQAAPNAPIRPRPVHVLDPMASRCWRIP